KQVKGAIIRDYATRVLVGDDAEKFEELSSVAQRGILRVEELHENGRGSDIKSVRGTLWGAYNAVTEFVDHDRAKESLGFLLDGRGAEIKQRAFTVAQELAKVHN